MSAPALQLDLPDDPTAGIWPWVVLCAAVLGTLLSARHVLISVPHDLRTRALEVSRTLGERDVRVSVSGRDIALSGTLRTLTDPDLLVQRVASIEGAGTITASLDVFDPRADAQARRAAFDDALGQLDLTGVAFEPGSVQVSAGSERALGELAALLKEAPEFRIRVSGHTDDTGRAEVNLRLSRERARAVADWLIMQGAKDDQVIAQGYGSTQPIADNATEAGRARNRRIEVRYVD